MGVQDTAERLVCSSVREWGDWLASHHARGSGVWLVTPRRAADRPFSYEEAVLEALRFGWVDSTQRPVDEQHSMLWFAPRTKQSLWTRPNRERIARLETEGRLEEAGRTAVEAARANGNWDLLQPAEDGVVPADLAAALDTAGADPGWGALTGSARKAALAWIITAKRPETRAARIAKVVTAAGEGRAVV